MLPCCCRFKRELFQLFRSERILFDDLCEDLPPSESVRAKQGNVGTMALLQPWEDCPFPSAIVVGSFPSVPCAIARA